MNKPIDENENARDALKSAFVARVSKNPKYSLRAFATLLGVDQSLLSKVLANKRQPSRRLIQKMQATIGFNEPQNKLNDSRYQTMSQEQFELISHWYHFAILELFKTKGFDPSPKSIAKTLHISTMEVALALERLQKLGYIRHVRGKWTLQKQSNTWLNEFNTTQARILLQKQLLEKALLALDEIPFQKRDHSSLTVAIDPELLPQVRERIKEFRRSLDSFIEKHGHSKQVYNLSIAFFPLTHEESL